MELFKNFVSAPLITPQLNVGCLQDIPTGKYLLGAHGESILLGGLNHIEAVGGRGNYGKSTFMFYRLLRAFQRYRLSYLQAHDTEDSLRFSRLNQLYRSITGQLHGREYVDLEESGRVLISNNTVMSGNKWFAGLGDAAEAKRKSSKDWVRTTPFIDHRSKKPITMMYPTLFGLDSLSQLTTDTVTDILNKNEVGDSANNTVYMRGGNAKTQLMMQLPTLCGQSGLFISMSLHVGDQIQLDQYNPNPKLLADMKANVSFKHAPKNITFLTNNLWYLTNSTVLANRDTKAPLYPRNADDDMAGDTDLRVMQVQLIRSKTGASGVPFELIWSQREGLLPGLSEFHYLKSHDRYGIAGNDRNYSLVLRPSVNLSRTTLRGKIDTDPLLRRALEITSELLQMTLHWTDTDGVFCTPQELFDDLTKMGYDWNTLLNTRGYWVFIDDEKDEPLPFLSTMDLLRMRKGLYHPFWMPAKSA